MTAALAVDDCPRCGEAWGALPPVESTLVEGSALRRCLRCGARFALDPAPRRIWTCTGCGLPAATGDETGSCADCAADDPRTDASTAAALVAGTEAELCAALERAWSFVGSPALAVYLDRMGQDVASRIDGAPRACRVAVFDDRAFKSLGLPSGTLLLSVGALASLENEAELAFLLGHELAHAASSSARARLVRLALRTVAREPAWTRVAEELIRLGHGLREEREADERAVGAVLELGYDARAVLRLFDRLGPQTARGAPELAELASAHPPPAERRLRLERLLLGRVELEGSRRINRELFRRAAGPEALAALTPVAGPERPRPPEPGPSSADRSRHRLVRLALGVLLLAALFLVFGLWLS